MTDPFRDEADFDLVPLPEAAADLLDEAGATPRLVAHLRLVHDVALRILDATFLEWPDILVDREAVLLGAATHDIGKAWHTEELYQPGTLHEIDGPRLLADRGVEYRLARFAETHAAWSRDSDCTIEDLFVALADTCWKGKRSEILENMLCDRIVNQTHKERWEIFATIDSIITGLAADADQRLAWQSRY